MLSKAIGYFLFVKLKQEKREKNPSVIYPHKKSTQVVLFLKLLLLNYRHQPWSFTCCSTLPGSQGLQEGSAKLDLLPPGNGSLSYLWKPVLGFSTKPLSGLICAVNAYSSFGFKLHLGILLSDVLGDICSGGGQVLSRVRRKNINSSAPSLETVRVSKRARKHAFAILKGMGLYPQSREKPFIHHRELWGFKYAALWLLFPGPTANVTTRLCVTLTKHFFNLMSLFMSNG